ncbi:PREDICTED: uncharacterized protein LOC109206125 [Nicotiana attenuata]|uniref:Uncharacterized protein n=1 Tax=Nicotiana attenuata TaxID=49451 RepID=A0A1J6J7J7_NICAT|nr:PREDICTED: uncharacterized protein LOC109206125 [Nicotiana attenuata]OIT05815.1 hypothetical protein A4A49_42805 [Nicotiana attenuata]
MPPYCLASPPVIEAQRAETSGTSSSTTSTDILEYLQQILQEQDAMRKNWDTFANTQAVMGAKMERVMLELADTKNGQNFIRQTLENHVSYTSPTMCSMENFLYNFSNVTKCFNGSNFQPHSFTGPSSSSFPDAGTSWCKIPQLSISMPLPPLDPMPFSNEAFFSDVTTISGIATSSIPIHFFNEGPSDATPHMEKNNFDMDLEFFHHDGTSSSGY